MNKSYDKFINTYSGRELMKSHNLSDYGKWMVRGEDPNCDLGGPHHQPLVGYFEGTLQQVIEYAVKHPVFWTWGGGGSIQPMDAKHNIVKL